MLTYKMAIALRPQICDVTSPYVYTRTIGLVLVSPRLRYSRSWFPDV